MGSPVEWNILEGPDLGQQDLALQVSRTLQEVQIYYASKPWQECNLSTRLKFPRPPRGNIPVYFSGTACTGGIIHWPFKCFSFGK